MVLLKTVERLRGDLHLTVDANGCPTGAAILNCSHVNSQRAWNWDAWETRQKRAALNRPLNHPGPIIRKTEPELNNFFFPKTTEELIRFILSGPPR